MNDLVTIDTDAGIADVRLNRPDKYNALNMEMFEAIIAAGESLFDANDVRAVVLSGNGKGFCAGLDFESFQRIAQGDGLGALLERGARPENFFQSTAYVWKRLPMPVIAVLHGVAYGGGCQIALAADIRIAAPKARLSVMEIKWGLIPDMAITQTLTDVVRIDVAKDLTYSGRIISGIEAAELGLVTRIDNDPLAAAFELAREIVGKSPHAVRAAKQLLDEGWRTDAATSLPLEAALQKELIGSLNQLEAVQANFDKRAPRFKDPV